MAKKIECDRCGKLVDFKKLGSEVSTVSITYTRKQNNDFTLNNYDWEEETKKVDLCLKCQVELLALFNKVDLQPGKGTK